MLFGYLVVRRLLPLVKGLGHLPPRASEPFAALLDASTRPFDWINYAGSVGGGRVLSPERMVRWLDSVTAKIERDIDRQSRRACDAACTSRPAGTPTSRTS